MEKDIPIIDTIGLDEEGIISAKKMFESRNLPKLPKHITTALVLFDNSPSGEIISKSRELFKFVAAWLVNSGSTDLSTYDTNAYASWITIDPSIGVVKDFTGLIIEISCYHDLINDTYKFIDNTNHQYPMVTNTFVSETGLDILVSAYVEEVTE